MQRWYSTVQYRPRMITDIALFTLAQELSCSPVLCPIFGSLPKRPTVPCYMLHRRVALFMHRALLAKKGKAGYIAFRKRSNALPVRGFVHCTFLTSVCVLGVARAVCKKKQQVR